MKKANPKFALKIACLILSISTVVFGCKNATKEQKEQKQIEEEVVEILTKGMDIQMPDSIPSGWHTFKYRNESNDTHLILFDKYPEGKTIKDTEHEVAPAFQRGMDLITEGKTEEGYEAFNELPKWFFDVVFTGGIGLISPGLTTETTMKLEPGYYVVECYVKMPNGVFHTSMGMATPLIVTEEVATPKKMKPTVSITVSGDEGIVYNETITKGKHLFSVNFKDQKVHEHFLGHDVNLVKVEDGADISVLEKWINWADPKGLISPAPDGFTFLGGVNDMPAGYIGYFSADLSVGNYVLIAEVPDASKKNMLKQFSVE